MAHMRIAFRAVHFRALHEKCAIGGGANRICSGGLVKAWPSRSGIKFGVRTEQRLSATHASEGAHALFVVQGAGKRPFRPMFSCHAIGFR